MKLRNKKTGEILEDTDILVLMASAKNDFPIYRSLTKLNEDWEDWEEPKPQVVYYIDRDGDIVSYKNTEYPKRVFDTEQNKEIGNYFETREEAEKAVEKLKAWQRLKDNGFEFTDWKFMPDMKHTKGNFVTIKAEIPYIVENEAALDLFFGGENE